MKTQMLVQVKQHMPDISDPCGPIGECGELKCPTGFIITEEPGHCCPYCVNPNLKIEDIITGPPGHCCPYCVNPNLKIEDIITGPTGVAGGKPSFMCPNVWCFPTMCTGAETMPNEGNGLCCP